MTANRLFEDCLESMAKHTMDIPDSPLIIKLDHEIDDVSMCEGYEIAISTKFLESTGSENIETDDGEHPDFIILFMEVKYQDCQPTTLIFYDDEYETPVLSCRINDDLRNPFGIRQYMTDREWSIMLIENVILKYFEGHFVGTIYAIVRNM